MNLQSLSASQTSPEVPINENFDVLDWATVYAKDPTTTSGLTWGYFGGRWGGTLVAAGTLSLTGGSPTTANYIVVNRSSGAISVSTSATNWNDTANYARVYKVTATGAAVESIEDHRAGPNGVIGDVGPAGANGTNGTNGIISTVPRSTFEAVLTLTTGSAFPASDQTGKTTVYLTPCGGKDIALYDNGSPDGWYGFTMTGDVNVAVPATTNTNYDVFVYNNSGTLTLEAVAWSSDTARATALVLQDGVLVKSGATNKRYAGSFRTTTSSGQTEDSALKRYLWNYYHRRRKNLQNDVERTDTWSYNTGSWRQANNNAANQLNFLVGVSEDIISASAMGISSCSASSAGRIGIGLDSSTANSARIVGYSQVGTATDQGIQQLTAFYRDYPGVGYHSLRWLEFGGGAGTQTWYGDAGVSPADFLTGITGELMC